MEKTSEEFMIMHRYATKMLPIITEIKEMSHLPKVEGREPTKTEICNAVENFNRSKIQDPFLQNGFAMLNRKYCLPKR